RVWNSTTGEPIFTLEHGSPLVDAVLSPDGKRLLTVGDNDIVKTWDLTTGERLDDVPVNGPVTAVAWSPDGRRIAAATKDSAVVVRSTDTERPPVPLRGHTARVTAIVFSADGTRVATASDDGTARVWDAATGTPRAVFPHEGPVQSLAFSPDGAYLTTASGDTVARRWSLRPATWHVAGCSVLEARSAHTEPTRACEGVTAGLGKVEPSSPQAEPVVVTPEPARPLPETKTVHGVELVLIPGGTFTMGSPPSEQARIDNEGPQHEVTLPSFYMARTEVTNAQYALYLETNPNVPKAPSMADQNVADYGQLDQPVTGLTWHEAKEYCDWAGLVLPTEAQWEYAVRAGTTTAYWYGDDPKDLSRFGWFDASTGYQERGLSGARPHTVGTKGTNPFGLFDMTGNVFEWTLDAFDSDETSPRTGDSLRHEPAGGANRVLRGGSWFVSAHVARSAFRLDCAPGYRSSGVGFRPALLIP
ncbi:MAG: SUMF1/EgtB/PvdO family nonheme iron enzyme, partial [Myxococcales bacterium]|nr:SUMF1/EgtB/PvdO family nonheme iron enzyme [Myxococcales bacterium]